MEHQRARMNEPDIAAARQALNWGNDRWKRLTIIEIEWLVQRRRCELCGLRHVLDPQ